MLGVDGSPGATRRPQGVCTVREDPGAAYAVRGPEGRRARVTAPDDIVTGGGLVRRTQTTSGLRV